MWSREKVGEVGDVSKPREGLVSRRSSALFNEVTRPMIEKWSLDCARRNDEHLSHHAAGWRSKTQWQLQSSRSFAQKAAEWGSQEFVIQAIYVCCHITGDVACNLPARRGDRDTLSKSWKQYTGFMQACAFILMLHTSSFRIHILFLSSRLYLSTEAHKCNLMVFLKFMTTLCHEWKESMGETYNKVLTNLNVWNIF